MRIYILGGGGGGGGGGRGGGGGVGGGGGGGGGGLFFSKAVCGREGKVKVCVCVDVGIKKKKGWRWEMGKKGAGTDVRSHLEVAMMGRESACRCMREREGGDGVLR